ncbi:OTU-like cysteine protease [Stachybotrys elegans]|uniref:Ubiquitin thioesterase OTU n=1 Tax=Stachybotrys elegans TaxID=80388 RepID=A0A8K0WT76_9HYPO|nr:OTU-like cysteine protease [Stachybotrys elegans]
MRARYKSPAGTGILDLPDDATVQAVFDELSSKTGISKFTLKYGPPMAMKSLDLTQKDSLARALGLHGESLTVVPEEPRPIEHDVPQAAKSMQHPPGGVGQPRPDTHQEEGPEDICVPWPKREGTLLLRVMPSDNSCLFTAFGGAVQENHSAQHLRRMMADYIMEHGDTYSEAVLGSKPSQYCQSIQDPDRWGGGIELSILSDIFNIQICTYDVQAENLISFGEGKEERCILVYSADITKWSTSDDEVLDKALELVKKLNAAHYYTDTEGLILRCDVPGCEWIGSGQLEGRKHAEKTGHVQLSEIRDNEEDNTLRSCDTPGCSFMGQGTRAMSQHTTDTGHKGFSVIPDW